LFFYPTWQYLECFS